MLTYKTGSSRPDIDRCFAWPRKKAPAKKLVASSSIFVSRQCGEIILRKMCTSVRKRTPKQISVHGAGPRCQWFDVSMVRSVKCPKCQWANLSLAQHFAGPTCHWSDVSSLRRVAGPTCQRSDVSSVRRVAGPTYHWSDRRSVSATAK